MSLFLHFCNSAKCLEYVLGCKDFVRSEKKKKALSI